ncbi:hypothetical protein BH23PLA1_BH23PLA1_32090 [soil metagenome]
MTLKQSLLLSIATLALAITPAPAVEPVAQEELPGQIKSQSNIRVQQKIASSPGSVAELRARHDGNLLQDLVVYLDQNPKAEDRHDAYLLIFEIGIAYDWFERTEPLARRYIREHPEGDVIAMARVLATMADTNAGRFRDALATYKDLLANLEDPEQVAFALDFADTLAANALAADDPATAREVYAALQQRYGDDPEIEQRIEGDLAQIARLGTPAPTIDSIDIEERPVRLEELRGKHVLVLFWAAWSETCVEELAALRDAALRHKEQGLEVVAVSLDPTREGLAEFLQGQGLDWVHVHASTCGVDWVAAFGVNSIPSTFLLNPDGMITRLGLRGESLDRLFQQAAPSE